MNNVDVHVLSLGMSNALRTGNVALDMALSSFLCLMLPMMVNKLWTVVQGLAMRFINWLLTAKNDRVYRHIETTEYKSQYGDYYSDDKNQILQKAIMLSVQAGKTKWQTSRATVGKNNISHITLLDTNKRIEDGEEGERRLTYMERQLMQLRLTAMPEDGVEVEVEPGLFFARNMKRPGVNNSNNEEEEEGTTQKRSTLLSLSAAGKDARERIDKFVETAYKNYQKEVSSKTKDKRYMLTLAKTPKATSDEGMVYTKYALSEEKTFESLFLPQKRDLLQLLSDFSRKEGKFAIQGFPNKLGILLYGPPGTGKTSLIKAIAQHTGRHIVSIPLKRIRTNQQLMELMYGGKFQCKGEDLAMRAKFNKLIFTLEDVDAASDVVRRRDMKRSDPELAALKKQLARAPPAPPSPGAVATGSDEGTGTGSGAGSGGGAAGPGLNPKWLEPDDELDLAGLLNALDGVVDCPGRIIVMTTNHPEHLDPALIRPGRINMKLNLGRLCVPEALQMLHHYFEGITEAEEEVVRAVFPDGRFTPAELEELCAENTTVADLAECIRRSCLARSKSKSLLDIMDSRQQMA